MECTAVGKRVKAGILLLLLLPFSEITAQNKKSKQEGPEKGQPTFRLPVNVVVINATVLDKKGKPVTDLTQSDFKVYQDGKPQAIQTFALEFYEPIQEEEENTAIPATPLSRRTTGTAPNASRPRMISILIDDITAASTDNFPQVIKAVTKFIEQDVMPEDQVAILSGSGRVHFAFTDDKQTLLEEIGTVYKKLNISGLTKSECPSLTDLQAKRIAEYYFDDGSSQSQNSSEDMASGTDPQAAAARRTAQEIQNIADMDAGAAVEETILCMSLDPSQDGVVRLAKSLARAAAMRQNQEAEYRASTLLYTLRQHLRILRHFDATKSAVVFSDGFLSEGVSHLSYELQDVVDQALSAGVVLNTVDIRGLFTSVLPASEGPGVTTPKLVQYKQSMYMDDMLAQETPLVRMANDTGGFFYHNSNDMYEGLKKTARRNSSYYVLTYAMPSQKSDGRFHQIKVELSRPGLELSYRKGYYAPKEELTFERRKKEDILEALQAPGNLNQIPIRLSYNYYQEDNSTYAVSLATNVSVAGLQFLDEESRRKNLINLVVAAFDEADHFVDGIEKSIDFRLTDASYANILAYGLTSRVEFKLPMGRYRIKAVVREGAEGKMGSVTKAVEIP